MISETKKQINTRHILNNTSKSKDSQAIKFGQLIKYSMINICLQRSYRKWGRETSSSLLFVFLKNVL